MNPSTWPRMDVLQQKLLWIQAGTGRLEDRHVEDLGQILRSGDLLVLNDAATLPASLTALTQAGERVEVRLAGMRQDGSFRAVLLGAGDWHQVTSERPPPPSLTPGQVLHFEQDLSASIRTVSPLSPRLYDIVFDRSGAALYRALYRQGRPVQYWYLEDDLAIWHVQTAYGSRPWAVEMPSAGRPLTLPFLRSLKAHGVALATITHAAGLSATGDEALDAVLPLPELYEVPETCVVAIEQTRARAGRVIAVGTSVVRALESAALAHPDHLAPIRSETSLRIGPGFRPRVVDALFTGMHEETESHFDLLHAFVKAEVLTAAAAHAAAAGYLCHEFGDSTLITR
jgi:S-adenosylmethionine:tRNA ribosyltransferase-isomerase